MTPSVPSVAVSMQQPGHETGDGAEDRPAQQRDREQRDEDDAGGAEGAVLGQDRQLQQRHDEQDECGLEAVHQRFGTSTITDCSDEKSTSGETWMFLKAFTSLLLQLLTDPIGMPRGNIDGSEPGHRAFRP